MTFQPTSKDFATWYKSIGWEPIRLCSIAAPCGRDHGRKPDGSPTRCGKAAIDDNWPRVVFDPTTFLPTDNVGVKLGAPSGGLVDLDLDCDEAVRLAPLILPPTATFGRASKPRSHWLYICSTKTAKPSGAGLELRSTGFQTVFPGSLHEAGEFVLWDDPNNYAPVVVDEATLLRAFYKLALAIQVAKVWPEIRDLHAAHDSALAFAGALFWDGWRIEDALPTLLAAFELDGSSARHREQAIRDTWEDTTRDKTGWPTLEMVVEPKTLRRMKRFSTGVVATYPTTVVESPVVLDQADPNATRPHHLDADLSDAANADRFFEFSVGRVKYCDGMGWLLWNGVKWETKIGPHWLIVDCARQLRARAESTGNLRLAKHANSWLGTGKIAATERLAREHASFRVEPDDLDSDPWLLNTPSGILNLQTGQLQPHSSEHLMTKMTSVSADPDLTCPLFMKFLTECFPGDPHTQNYLLRWLGYCLTGSIEEHIFNSWYGTHGSNGKGTTIKTLQNVMGSYWSSMGRGVLFKGRHDGDRFEFARHRGVRLAVVDEAAESARWDEALLKALTGGSTITAEEKGEGRFDFNPSFKLIVSANGLPSTSEQGGSLWRRCHVVEWPVCFTGRADTRLPEKLEKEAEGILGLLVWGCGQWWQQRLKPSDAMIKAKNEYHEEQDWLAEFEEMFVEDSAAFLSNKELGEIWMRWSADLKHAPDLRTLRRMLKQRGWKYGKRRSSRGFLCKKLSNDVIR